jgi:hypothetical protein
VGEGLHLQTGSKVTSWATFFKQRK